MRTAVRAAPSGDAECLRAIVDRSMSAQYLVMKTRELTGEAQTPEAFFGFRSDEVAEVHFRKRGVGRGCWYRLRDGRVIDALGRPSQPTHACYSTGKRCAAPESDRADRRTKSR
jgi:hypothetical protein